MDAQFVRLWPGQDLIGGEKAIELRRVQPTLLLDQFAADHRDLRDGPTPGEEAEAEEAKEEPAEAGISRRAAVVHRRRMTESGPRASPATAGLTQWFDVSRNIEMKPQPVVSGRAVAALAALAQEHRLTVFRLLVQSGERGLAAGEIADSLGLAPSSLSFHLAHLHSAGLVTRTRNMRSIIYAADYSAMTDLIAFLTENCCAGAECSAAPARAAAEAER